MYFVIIKICLYFVHLVFISTVFIHIKVAYSHGVDRKMANVLLWHRKKVTHEDKPFNDFQTSNKLSAGQQRRDSWSQVYTQVTRHPVLV